MQQKKGYLLLIQDLKFKLDTIGNKYRESTITHSEIISLVEVQLKSIQKQLNYLINNNVFDYKLTVLQSLESNNNRIRGLCLLREQNYIYARNECVCVSENLAFKRQIKCFEFGNSFQLVKGKFIKENYHGIKIFQNGQQFCIKSQQWTRPQEGQVSQCKELNQLLYLNQTKLDNYSTCFNRDGLKIRKSHLLYQQNNFYIIALGYEELTQWQQDTSGQNSQVRAYAFFVEEFQIMRYCQLKLQLPCSLKKAIQLGNQKIGIFSKGEILLLKIQKINNLLKSN